MLFDATRQEILSQFDALGDDAQQAESLLVNLSAFQRIAFKHLIAAKSSERGNVGEARWLMYASRCPTSR